MEQYYSLFLNQFQRGATQIPSGSATQIPSGSATENYNYGGVALREGSESSQVTLLQKALDAMSYIYPSINKQIVNGFFGANLRSAVVAYQNLYGLTADGIVGKSTWDSIIKNYQNILNGTKISIPIYPGKIIRLWDSSDMVYDIQAALSKLSVIYNIIPSINVDGIFGASTNAAVMAFQKLFSLSADGAVGKSTWDAIFKTYLEQSSLPMISSMSVDDKSLINSNMVNTLLISQLFRRRF